jgi:hypothetical protein
MGQPAQSANELLEWTISDAPDFAEAEAPAAPPMVTPRPASIPRPRPKLSRRQWLILLASLGTLSLTFALCPSLGHFVIRAQLAQIVQQEDNAALAGDGGRLQQLSDPAWLKKQQAITVPGEIVPRPLAMLTPAREPGDVRAWEWAASNLARVEVARKFTTPDGQAYTFIVPQYYRYADSAWQRVAPPERSEILRTWADNYLEVTYAEDDAELVVKELAPDLETILARACAVWVCPDAFKISISFGITPRTFFPSAPLPNDPLLFAQTPVLFSRSPRNTLSLPAPSRLGWPLETDGVELFKRAVAAQMLLVAADGVLFSDGERDLARNAFLYALVARLGAQLNVEAPTVYDILTSPLTRSPGVLWDIGIRGAPRSGDEMRRALALVNWILRGRPSESDLALFDALREANDPETWLTLGLGLAPADARTLWDTAEAATFDVDMGYRVAAPPDFDYPLALGCRTGPALVLRDDSIFRPLPDYGTWASVLAIAPSRERLALSLAGQPAILDFVTERVYALPNTTPNNLLRLTWLDRMRVAYAMSPSFWSHEFTLNFFDVAAPRQPARTLLNLMDYALAPNHSLAAVVSAESITALGPALQGAVGLMPAEGGPITTLDAGALPAWSPDGRQLAYLHGESLPGNASRHQFALRLAEVSASLTRTLFAFSTLGPDDPVPFSPPVWSPDGNQMAFTASQGEELYLLLVALDGGHQKIALGPNLYSATQVAFSADGNVIAVMRFDDRDDVSTLLYRVAPVAAVFPFLLDGAVYWAPSGPDWVLAEPNRVSRLDSFRLSNARPLLNDDCDAVWADPGAP